ncbi:unnamed protein product [Amoebophrya sp. A120]|nr:unnamed protein product [Amoebophrya sp. A120]|eukprot:GSA120T00008526001.1
MNFTADFLFALVMTSVLLCVDLFVVFAAGYDAGEGQKSTADIAADAEFFSELAAEDLAESTGLAAESEGTVLEVSNIWSSAMKTLGERWKTGKWPQRSTNGYTGSVLPRAYDKTHVHPERIAARDDRGKMSTPRAAELVQLPPEQRCKGVEAEDEDDCKCSSKGRCIYIGQQQEEIEWQCVTNEHLFCHASSDTDV